MHAQRHLSHHTSGTTVMQQLRTPAWRVQHGPFSRTSRLEVTCMVSAGSLALEVKAAAMSSSACGRRGQQ